MNINKVNDVYKEIAWLTQEQKNADQRNMQIEECIMQRPAVPFDNDQLNNASRGIAKILGAAPLEVMALATLSSMMGLSRDENSQFISDLVPYTLEYKAKEVKDNPYYKNIKFPKTEIGRFKAVDMEMRKGEIFLDQEPVARGYHRTDCIGVFDDGFAYPCIFEGDMCWMSITPNEIITMEEDVDKATGDVLTIGLGLGYYAYMVHLKDDVKSVTIVERQPEVIEIFEKYILPQFEHPEKIRIVNEDAFEYLEKLEDGKFDYCFCDIWQNPTDGMEDYLHIKKLGNRFEKTTFSYWIEESFLGLLQTGMTKVFQVEWLDAEDDDLQEFIEYRTMKELLKDVDVECGMDVRKMFTSQYLLETLKKL